MLHFLMYDLYLLMNQDKNDPMHLDHKNHRLQVNLMMHEMVHQHVDLIHNKVLNTKMVFQHKILVLFVHHYNRMIQFVVTVVVVVVEYY